MGTMNVDKARIRPWRLPISVLWGFGMTSIFEKTCENSIAGGIDLAGLFPRYINIRRGVISTFVVAWVLPSFAVRLLVLKKNQKPIQLWPLISSIRYYCQLLFRLPCTFHQCDVDRLLGHTLDHS